MKVLSKEDADFVQNSLGGIFNELREIQHKVTDGGINTLHATKGEILRVNEDVAMRNNPDPTLKFQVKPVELRPQVAPTTSKGYMAPPKKKQAPAPVGDGIDDLEDNTPREIDTERLKDILKNINALIKEAYDIVK